MTFEEAWDKLIEMGTLEQTIVTVTNINGNTYETLCDILYAEYGYNDFNQVTGRRGIDW